MAENRTFLLCVDNAVPVMRGASHGRTAEMQRRGQAAKDIFGSG
jgi:hypothetical protein